MQDHGGSNGAVLRDIFAGERAVPADTLIHVYEDALRAAPVGVTVVDRTGHVLRINAFQRTVSGCPWREGVRTTLPTNEHVPASVRSGLRRILRQGANEHPTEPAHLPPVAFPGCAELWDTWLIPVQDAGHLVAVVIVQYEHAASRLLFPRGAAGEQGGSPRPVPLAQRGSPRINLESLRRQYRLTERELQVVNALCRGMATPAIAQEMQISAHTVKDYLKRIQRKMDARGRLAIAVKAMTAP